MLLFFILSAAIIWHATLLLAFIINWNIRLITIIRWATIAYLVIFGLLFFPMVMEGLLILGQTDERGETLLFLPLGWVIWYVLATFAIVHQRLLPLAVVVPVVAFMMYPELRLSMDYGLAKTGWLEVVYTPFTWAAKTGLKLYFNSNTSKGRAAGVHKRIPIPTEAVPPKKT
ncbi:uncharacterized protein F4822DRAFT_301380 [Hypoxylon trugodes]|uniref:uncharacterized protein n=1 Tax=Hypoxylon trugodes TaxID=326681 RepID=UPI0021965145|nr:uncharacterized protein F4822DRAFT_301380 [Hypoxylon trugodes]KAI1388071.1 hypothetical protein F4822DRAFT_301380 [Hypoxylon trugodes]